MELFTVITCPATRGAAVRDPAHQLSVHGLHVCCSGGSRNLERGVQPLGHEAALENFLGCHAHFRYVNALVTHVIIVATDWWVASELFKIAGSPS